MAKIIRCPKCGNTYTPMDAAQEVYCNGKRKEHSIGHKPVRMVPRA